jgi:hypothetical protein
MCGCIRCIRMPAVATNCWSRRVAACRSIRRPYKLRRIGPCRRPSTASSIARATAGGNGTKTILSAFAANLQDTVAVFLAEVADIRAAGFEDPQPEQAKHRDQREVVSVGRQPCGRQQGLEL